MMIREKWKAGKIPIKTVSGALEGPSGSKAEYYCTIRFGLNAEDFLLNKRFHPRQRPNNHTIFLKSEKKVVK
jgi:hypothetical protein